MNFDIYLTTNYDNILSAFIKTKFYPINLKDLSSNTQTVLNDEQKRIFHLHGNMSQQDSIVLSEDSYLDLYNNKKYNKLFSLLTGSKTFLFLGFSFNDTFIKRIIRDNKEFFNTKHYIILNNPQVAQIEMLKSDYNIETLSYNFSLSNHATEIRKLLNQISASDRSKTDESLTQDIIEHLLIGLPDSKEKNKLEESLFCKKLRLESINENLVDYSKNCFYTAEQYIRWLNKSNIFHKDKVIQHILGLCYLEYQDLLIRIYEVYENSEEFLKSVHAALKTLDCSRTEKILGQKVPLDFNKQGFIHVLADDKKTDNEVWWGGTF